MTASTGDLETVAPPVRSSPMPRAARPSHNVIGHGSSFGSSAAQEQTQDASPPKPKMRHNSLPSTEVERMKFDEAHSISESRTDAIEALRGGADLRAVSPAPEDIPRSSSRMGESTGRRHSMPATEAERVAATFAQKRGAGLKQQVTPHSSRAARAAVEARGPATFEIHACLRRALLSARSGLQSRRVRRARRAADCATEDLRGA